MLKVVSSYYKEKRERNSYSFECLSLVFCEIKKEMGEIKMSKISFESLDDVFSCYGRGNLVAIDYLPQILFYTRKGCQPVFVYESEVKPGKLSAWFLKAETSFVYKKWLNNKQD